MRKGRSSRRSRVSRPPILKGTVSESLGADAGPSSTPRVVLSVPPSDPVAEARSSVASAPPPAAAAQPEEEMTADDEALAAAPEPEPTAPSLPPVADDDPPGADAAGELVPSTRPSATLPPPSDPSDAAVAVAPPSNDAPPEAVASEPAKKKKKKKPTTSVTPPPVVAPGDATEADDEVESAEHVAMQEKFFSEGDLSRHLDGHLDDAVTPSKAMRMAEPAVVERRARFARYVKWAVAIAGVLCVAAIGRTLVTSGEAPRGPAAEPKAVATAEPAAPAPKPVESVPQAAPAPSAPAPAASEPATSATAAEEPPPAPPTGDAKEEKKNAQSALEHRKIADAIAAGEKSVALDPTDGEAWLILGAAFQEKGDMAAARRAFASCVKEAKTGPVAECGKMLR